MLRRIVPATAVAALLLAGVAGCSAQSTADACDPALEPGALSDGTAVTGSFGETPKVEVPADTRAMVSQRTIVESAADRGEQLEAGDEALVGVDMAFFDAKTGEQLYESQGFASGEDAPEFLLFTDALESPLVDALRCSAPGDRLAVALAGDDGGQLAMQLGGDPAAGLVGVIDVRSASPLAAQGKTRGLPNGFPAVATDENGVPGVVLAPRDLPEGTKSAVRIEGAGEQVTEADTVIAQVLAINPDATVAPGAPVNQKIVASTWQSGGPTMLGTEAQESQNGNPMRAELTGRSVGSQVVILTNDGESSQVAVVDIIGVG